MVLAGLGVGFRPSLPRRRRRRWRNGISPSGFVPVSSVLLSGAGDESVEVGLRLCRSPWPATSLLGVRRDEVGVGLLFPGWRGSSGLRGDVEVGSSSYFPWRWLSSMASSDSRPSLLGAWPRPMCVLRLCSFVWMSFYCGSVQSLRAMERSRIWADVACVCWLPAIGGNGCRRLG